MSIFKKIARKAESRVFCTAVIVAAGSSARMGFDKLMAPLCGVPVLVHTLRAFELCERVDEIIVVTQSEKIAPIAELCKAHDISKATKILMGGETRLHSSLAGVCEADPRARVIAVHDGARPLVTSEIISAAVHEAVLNRAAAPAIPVRDTIKSAENGVVTSTPDRATLFAVQTPQIFDADIIKAALTDALQKGVAVTDDCAAVEAMGVKIRLTAGSDENIKITTPVDLLTAEGILRKRGGIA